MANTTLYTTADAPITEGSPDNNYGTATTLIVRSVTDGNVRVFLKFDLSSIPVDQTITLAKLRINCYLVADLLADVTDVEARKVSDDSWAEGTITWNNQKAYGDVADTQVPSVAWVEWTVTDYVKDEYEGDQTVSFCLKCETESYDGTNRRSYYRSKEYDSGSTKPELYIEYSTGVKIPVAMHHLNRINKIIRG